MSAPDAMLAAAIRIAEMQVATCSYIVKAQRATLALGEAMIEEAPRLNGAHFPMAQFITAIQELPRMREMLTKAMANLADAQEKLAMLHKISEDTRDG